jgi:hypothetical protein
MEMDRIHMENRRIELELETRKLEMRQREIDLQSQAQQFQDFQTHRAQTDIPQQSDIQRALEALVMKTDQVVTKVEAQEAIQLQLANIMNTLQGDTQRVRDEVVTDRNDFQMMLLKMEADRNDREQVQQQQSRRERDEMRSLIEQLNHRSERDYAQLTKQRQDDQANIALMYERSQEQSNWGYNSLREQLAYQEMSEKLARENQAEDAKALAEDRHLRTQEMHTITQLAHELTHRQQCDRELLVQYSDSMSSLTLLQENDRKERLLERESRLKDTESIKHLVELMSSRQQNDRDLLAKHNEHLVTLSQNLEQAVTRSNALGDEIRREFATQSKSLVDSTQQMKRDVANMMDQHRHEVMAEVRQEATRHLSEVNQIHEEHATQLLLIVEEHQLQVDEEGARIHERDLKRVEVEEESNPKMKGHQP